MYAIIERQKWDGVRDVAEHDSAIRFVHPGSLEQAVDRITGRGQVIRIPSVARRLRVQGRVYVAPARGMSGALVERMR